MQEGSSRGRTEESLTNDFKRINSHDGGSGERKQGEGVTGEMGEEGEGIQERRDKSMEERGRRGGGSHRGADYSL